MREFLIQMTAVISVVLAWLTIWTVALRAFDICVLTRTAEARASTRERILRMGKGRYILIFGLLGFGLAMGLGMAVSSLVEQTSLDWIGAAIRLVFWTVISDGRTVPELGTNRFAVKYLFRHTFHRTTDALAGEQCAPSLLHHLPA